jgi:hypothetical protein
MSCERLILNKIFELKNVYSIMDLYIEYSIEVNVYGFKKKDPSCANKCLITFSWKILNLKSF